jgi:hypothetical protein
MTGEEVLDEQVLVTLHKRDISRLVAAARIIQTRAGSRELGQAIEKLEQAAGVHSSQTESEGS